MVYVAQDLQNGDTAECLLKSLEGSRTLPLWTQMSRLNPPKPNPTAVPFLWKYQSIRPNLLRAGNLITEKQAERRVLMLINPTRGMSLFGLRKTYTLKHPRCTIYNRHAVCRAPTGHA